LRATEGGSNPSMGANKIKGLGSRLRAAFALPLHHRSTATNHVLKTAPPRKFPQSLGFSRERCLLSGSTEGNPGEEADRNFRRPGWAREYFSGGEMRFQRGEISLPLHGESATYAPAGFIDLR
jgi:hypothetical protein